MDRRRRTIRYKLLGRTGCRVSELCLGTMTFGRHDLGWGNDDPRQVREMFDVFAEAGGNFVDTSDAYTGGVSERSVGEAIAADRDHWVVATKYSSSFEGDPSKAGNSRKHMVEAVEASLKRLGTDHIDVYFLHVWDGMTPIDEVMQGLDDLVRQGKVVYVGLSNTPAWVCGAAWATAGLRGWAPLVSIQVGYSLVQRTVERELIPMATALDMAVLAYGPLGAGLLTGKALTSSDRSGRAGVVPDGRTRPIVEEVLAVAEEIGSTSARVALSWLRSRPGVVIPILGARTAAQLRDNLGCLDVVLDEPQLDRLDAVSAIDLGYPHSQHDRDRIRDVVTGGIAERIDVHRPLLGPSPMSALERRHRRPS
jgi:aryl-alcohol dehydrogenase-like predicted oxidoreductase